MPDLIIVAGPNGAGRTTFGNELRTRLLIELVYINADAIEAELNSSAVDCASSLGLAGKH